MTDAERLESSRVMLPGEVREFLWNTIKRYDGFYAAVNTKANVALAFNALIIAGVVLKWSDILGSLENQSCLYLLAAYLLFLLVLGGVVSLYRILRVLLPFLKSRIAEGSAPPEFRSLIFFGDVARNADAASYHQLLTTQSMEQQEWDLTVQAHTLATGLSEKFDGLKAGIRVMYLFTLPVLGCLILVLLVGALAARLSQVPV